MRYLAILSIVFGTLLYGGCIRPQIVTPGGQTAAEAGGVDEAGNPVVVPPELGRAAARQALAANAAWMKWIGLLFVILGILVLIASFLPWTAFIPRGAAIGGLAGGLACWAIQYVLLVYGVVLIEVGFWVCIALTIAAAAFVGYPLVVAWRNRQIGKTAEKLIAKPDDKRAGVALMAVAKGLDTDERKELLKSVGG